MTKNPERGENKDFENFLSWNLTLAFGFNSQENRKSPFSGNSSSFTRKSTKITTAKVNRSDRCTLCSWQSAFKNFCIFSVGPHAGREKHTCDRRSIVPPFPKKKKFADFASFWQNRGAEFANRFRRVRKQVRKGKTFAARPSISALQMDAYGTELESAGSARSPRPPALRASSDRFSPFFPLGAVAVVLLAPKGREPEVSCALPIRLNPVHLFVSYSNI